MPPGPDPASAGIRLEYVVCVEPEFPLLPRHPLIQHYAIPTQWLVNNG